MTKHNDRLTNGLLLWQAYQDFFPIGAAIGAAHLTSHADVLPHFNSISPENCLKFENTHPEPDRYTFAEADQLADFARREQYKMRGHTLVWHQQTPAWVFQRADGRRISREELLERMHEHIHTVVSRYRGTIYCWDVVNEAINDVEGALLRESPWLTFIGEDYVQQAFHYAHAADPDAVLFYNDYNETDPDKRGRILTMLSRLLADGVPIHGMGLQAHLGPQVAPDALRQAIEAYAALGLQVQITELDLSMYAWEEPQPPQVSEPTPAMLAQQAEQFAGLFQLFREYRDVITGVTLWGVADDATWLDQFPIAGRKNWPLLFDTAHQPKEACRRIMAF